jgi:predicted nucleic acid-binding protein
VLGTSLADSIGKTIRAPRTHLYTPALCDVEVVSGLRTALTRNELSSDRAAEALHDYKDLPLHQHGHRPLLQRVFELRSNFSAYDATYVALAERLDAEFLTADERLARSVRSHTSVRLIQIKGLTMENSSVALRKH